MYQTEVNPMNIHKLSTLKSSPSTVHPQSTSPNPRVTPHCTSLFFPKNPNPNPNPGSKRKRKKEAPRHVAQHTNLKTAIHAPTHTSISSGTKPNQALDWTTKLPEPFQVPLQNKRPADKARRAVLAAGGAIRRRVRGAKTGGIGEGGVWRAKISFAWLELIGLEPFIGYWIWRGASTTHSATCSIDSA